MPTRIHRNLSLLVLIAAGEAVFFLPFLLARVFRPTVLDVFGLSNLELGTFTDKFTGYAVHLYKIH